jgi:hypothetical protein
VGSDVSCQLSGIRQCLDLVDTGGVLATFWWAVGIWSTDPAGDPAGRLVMTVVDDGG